MTHEFTHGLRKRIANPIPCTWCGESIEIGDKYYTWGRVHDGYMNRINMHPECEEVYRDCDRTTEVLNSGEMIRGEIEE